MLEWDFLCVSILYSLLMIAWILMDHCFSFLFEAINLTTSAFTSPQTVLGYRARYLAVFFSSGASNALCSSKNDHHWFFDVCLACLVGLFFCPWPCPNLSATFCHQWLQMPRPWLVKLMTASLRQFLWIQTMSCECIFPRQGLQAIIYALDRMSSNSP